jgi:pyridoxal phosphate enzyme (YggS family)
MYKELIEFCSERGITMVAVTKTRSIEAIQNLYESGHRNFGENRVPELVEKHEVLPKDISWHMIGHLQSKKVKYIAPFVSMIHSGASLSLLKEIDKRAANNERMIDVLLQIKIANEEAKSGWNIAELSSELSNNELQKFENIRIRGVMGMATFTSDESMIKSEFSNLKSYFDKLKGEFFSNHDYFDTISMGMSGDYKLAALEGSTMVRIGSLLFQ